MTRADDPRVLALWRCVALRGGGGISDVGMLEFDVFLWRYLRGKNQPTALPSSSHAPTSPALEHPFSPPLQL